jgi:hypothetical protein
MPHAPLHRTPEQLGEQACRMTTCAVCGGFKRRQDAFCLQCWLGLPEYMRTNINWNWDRGFVRTRVKYWLEGYEFLTREVEDSPTFSDVEDL